MERQIWRVTGFLKTLRVTFFDKPNPAPYFYIETNREKSKSHKSRVEYIKKTKRLRVRSCCQCPWEALAVRLVVLTKAAVARQDGEGMRVSGRFPRTTPNVTVPLSPFCRRSGAQNPDVAVTASRPARRPTASAAPVNTAGWHTVSQTCPSP